MIKRIAITGSSGYYGRKFVEHVRRVAPEAEILGIDIVPPGTGAPDNFQKLDVRDPAVRTAIAEFRPDTILHLAFILDPIHNTRKMHDINVGGTLNVMEAVRTVRPQRFQMSSSATAYGALPDNPVPMDETWPLRTCGTLQYALDKVELEGAIRKLESELPDVTISWTRPAIIWGEGIKNHLIDVILRFPVVCMLDGADVAVQFVHEKDLATATWEILSRGARGPFNVGPPDWIMTSELAKLTNRKTTRIPYWLLRSIAFVRWNLRFRNLNVPPGFLDFLRNPWVVAPARLERELGFKFQYSTRDTLMQMWDAYQQSRGDNNTAGAVGSQNKSPAQTGVGNVAR